MNNKKVFVYVLSLLILSSFTYAAGLNLDSLLYPVRSLNLGTFYLNYFAFIDAIIYLILFLSLAQIVFLKVYPNNKKEAKTVAVAISLVLTISMVLVEMNTRFNLGMLQPVALLVFLLMIAILLYNLLHGLFGDEGKTSSAALTYLVIYGLLVVPFGTLNKWIETNVKILSSVLAIAAIVAFIYLVIELFRVLSRSGKNARDSIKEWGGGSNRGGRDGPRDGRDGPGGTSDPNTITISVPQTAGYAYGDVINVAFDTAGPGFRGTYDYDIYINGSSPHGVRRRVSGNNIADPIHYTMGTAPTRVGINNTLQVRAYRRGAFGGTGREIARAQVIFPIAAGGGGGGVNLLRNIINNDYANILNVLNQNYRNYFQLFNQIILMHYDFTRGSLRSRDPGAFEWRSLLTLRNTMNAAANAPVPTPSANNILNAIRTHPDYAALTSADTARLTTLMNYHLNISNAIITCEIAARNAYNTAAGPIPITNITPP